MSANPHIWRKDAAHLYEAFGEAGRIARDLVLLDEDPGQVFCLTLPVNEDFEPPNEIHHEAWIPLYDEEGEIVDFEPPEEERGVLPFGLESGTAQAAITLRTLGELIARDTLQWWTLREIAARERKGLTKSGRPRKRPRVSGRVQLARDLMETGVPSPPSLKDPTKAERNMLRKVEEWAEGKYRGMPRGANRLRVDLLRNGAINAAHRHVDAIAPMLGLSGDWRFSKEVHFAKVHTQAYDPGDQERCRDVLKNSGNFFISTVEDSANQDPDMERAQPQLVWLHALHVEVTYDEPKQRPTTV